MPGATIMMEAEAMLPSLTGGECFDEHVYYCCYFPHLPRQESHLVMKDFGRTMTATSGRERTKDNSITVEERRKLTWKKKMLWGQFLDFNGSGSPQNDKGGEGVGGKGEKREGDVQERKKCDRRTAENTEHLPNQKRKRRLLKNKIK